MTTGLMTTIAGQSALVADAAAAAELAITHVAFGDSDGVPYLPTPEQVDLVNERYRSPIAAMAVVDGELVIDAIIPADTDDASARPSHGFNVHEAGLWGTTGGTPVLIGVAQMGGGYKSPPSSGQASIATFRFKLAVANPSTISVVIDATAQIAIGRLVRAGWITVDGILNAPPAEPVLGATYVIGAAPTGAWTGFAGRIAQWIGVWSLSEAPLGHIVADNSKAESDPLRYLKHATATTWVSAAATETAHGFTRLSTVPEALAGALNNAAVTPEGLKAAKETLPLLFVARAAADTTVTPDVWTKLSLGTEVVDTGAAFTPATGRFQPTKAGYYVMWGVCTFGSNTDTPTTGVRIYQNGVVVNSGLPSTILGSQFGCAKNGSTAVCSGISYFNGTTDYAELFGIKGSHTASPNYTCSNAFMAGYYLGVGA